MFPLGTTSPTTRAVIIGANNANTVTKIDKINALFKVIIYIYGSIKSV